MERKRLVCVTGIMIFIVAVNSVFAINNRLSYDEVVKQLREENIKRYAPMVPALIKEIDSEDEYIRIWAAILLGKSCDIRAVDTLAKHLINDESAEVRYQCAISLGIIRSQDAIPALTEALKDSVGKIALESAVALSLLGEKEHCLPVLSNALNNSNRNVRMKALKGLRYVGNPEAIFFIETALDDMDPYVRVNAAIFLTELGENASAFLILEESLNSLDKYIRLAALRGLKNIGNNESILLITIALSDHDWEVQKRAIYILQDLGVNISIENLNIVPSGGYNVDAAVAYAEEWWDGRNPAYNDYSNVGGDCANFVSQCLIAGGLDLTVCESCTWIDEHGCLPRCNDIHTYLVDYKGAQYERRNKGEVEPIWFVKGDPAIFGNTSDPWTHAVFAVIGDNTHYAECNAHSYDVYHKTIPWFFQADPSFQLCNYYHISESVSGYAAVSEGVTVTPSTIYEGETFNVTFTLKEIQGAPITFAEITCAILDANDNHLFDLKHYENVTVPANGTWTYTGSGYLDEAGTYKAVARGRVTDWFDFTTTGNGVNPREFQVIEESGYAAVSEGVTVIPSQVCVDERYEVTFTLKEINGAPITFAEIAVLIRDANNNDLFYLDEHYYNVTIPADGTWDYYGHGWAVGKLSTPGTYKAVARGRVNGDWFDFTTTGNGVNPREFEVVSKPNAAFFGSPTSGCAQLTVQFTDTSTNNPTSWSWTFGDGGTSTQQNPSHTYTSAGIYTVSLTASNQCGPDTETKTNYITVLPKPVADFFGTPTKGDVPLTVQFTDQSTNNPTSWLWEFGDGDTSTQKNPSNTYTNPGTYTVSLTATNSCGSDTETKTNYIEVTKPGQPPVADFEGNPTQGCVPLNVQFTDKSTNNPTSWSWTFGDGGTSTAPNPSHTYNNPGKYTVSLTATNQFGFDTETKTNYITVLPQPTADFVANPISGCAPLTVQFTDESSGNPTSWSWDFGDGGTSTQQNPSHTYTSADTYTVSLTASNQCGPDTEVKTNYITVLPKPIADFVCTPTSGCVPLCIQCTDTSTGAPTSWSWDFGDGGTSTEQNPSHCFTAPGTYTVCLTVFNQCGSDTECKTNYITVLPKPTADFVANPTSGYAPLPVQFTDNSTGNPTSWQWNFGDGETSDQQNPQHTYTDTGEDTVYTVSLTASNQCGSDTKTKPDYIEVKTPKKTAFTFSPESPQEGEEVQFTDQSTPQDGIVSWDWDFGDGDTSTEQNPKHTYTQADNPSQIFDVSLTVKWDDGGSDQEIKSIEVTDKDPVAQFHWQPPDPEVGQEVQFFDDSQSYDGIVSWEWDFGDGETSTEQNPKHTYNKEGTYHVTLTVTESDGDDSLAETDITVEKSTITLTGNLLLQGRTDHSALVVFEVCYPGETTPIEEHEVTTQTNGDFVFDVDVPAGIYDFMAKEWHYLRGIDREVTIPPTAPLIFDPEIPGAEAGTLRGGDCNNDNRINIQDFGILASFFGEIYELPEVIPPPLPPPHPWHADLNGDLRINIQDFGVLASNFGEIGVESIDAIAAPNTPSGTNVTALIRPEVRGENLSVKNFIQVPLGKEFELNIIAENVIDLHGYSFHISYDSSMLKMQELGEGFAQAGEFLKQNSEQKPTLFLTRNLYQAGSLVKQIVLSGCITGAKHGVKGKGPLANLRLNLLSSQQAELLIDDIQLLDCDGKINQLPEQKVVIRAVPQKSALLPNYPNPFNPETWVPYQLAKGNEVEIKIYNLKGELIRSLHLGYRPAGYYLSQSQAAYWDGKNEAGEAVASGIYFYHLSAGDFQVVRKMAIIK